MRKKPSVGPEVAALFYRSPLHRQASPRPSRVVLGTLQHSSKPCSTHASDADPDDMDMFPRSSYSLHPHE
jgi:hypothetical protein